MAKLTSKERSKLPKSDFAGPGRSYPVPDKNHARFAEAMAEKEFKRGLLTKSERAKIDAKAAKKLKG